MGIPGGRGYAVAQKFTAEGAQVLGSYRTMRPELETFGAKPFALDTDDRDS